MVVPFPVAHEREKDWRSIHGNGHGAVGRSMRQGEGSW
jgi:hypothetical protein